MERFEIPSREVVGGSCGSLFLEVAPTALAAAAAAGAEGLTWLPAVAEKKLHTISMLLDIWINQNRGAQTSERWKVKYVYWQMGARIATERQ